MKILWTCYSFSLRSFSNCLVENVKIKTKSLALKPIISFGFYIYWENVRGLRKTNEVTRISVGNVQHRMHRNSQQHWDMNRKSGGNVDSSPSYVYLWERVHSLKDEMHVTQIVKIHALVVHLEHGLWKLSWMEKQNFKTSKFLVRI